jgi:hypothetical protein
MRRAQSRPPLRGAVSMIPRPLIVLPLLVAFVMCTVQYYRIDPKRRLFNLRFVLMITSAAAAFAYPIYTVLHPGDRLTSRIFLGLAITWLAASYVLLRRMPPHPAR